MKSGLGSFVQCSLVQFTVYSVLYSLQYKVYCTAYSLQCTVYCTVYNVQLPWAIYSVHCTTHTPLPL